MTRVFLISCSLIVPIWICAPALAAEIKIGNGDFIFASTLANSQAGGRTVEVRLKVPADVSTNSVEMKLNGRAYDSIIRSSSCTSRFCEVIWNVGEVDGLVGGKNVVQAAARRNGKWLNAKARFNWSAALSAAATVQPVLPPSLNLTTLGSPSGTQPWVQVGDRTFPNYGADANTPTEACTTLLHLLVIDRAQLTQVSYKCYSTSADLRSALANVTTTQLALAGTTQQNYAPQGLDTTPIGGTNFGDGTFSAATYPQGYIVLGAGGAPAGQATENYFVATSTANPYPWAQFLQGLLVEDGNNYSFHWSQSRPFVADPAYQNQATNITGPAVITDTVYTPGPLPGGSGLWVLVLDRTSLQPIDATHDGQGPCQYASYTSNVCGQVFASDDDSAAQYLAGLSNRNLVFVMAVGTPFSKYSDQSLANAVASLGGSEYDVAAMRGVASSYTLISIPGEPGFQTAVNGKAVVSTTLNTGQNGRVTGLLMRDLKSMYAPTIWSQTPNAAPGQGVDFSYYILASQQTTPWPHMDTEGSIAAYHYISSKIAPSGAVAPGLYDYRSYYAGGQIFTVVTNPVDPTTIEYISSFDDPILGQNISISQAEFSNVAKQLKVEQANLKVVYSAFIGSGDASFASLFDQTGLIPLALIEAAAAVQGSAMNPTPATVGQVNWSNILNVAAGFTSIGGVFAPAAGVVSGILWTASGFATDNPFYTPGTPSIPNPDRNFTVSFSKLAGDTGQLSANLSQSFSESMDNIFSDWGKLSAAAQHVTSDWLVPNQGSLNSIKSAFVSSAKQNFFLQLIPSYYQVDAYLSAWTDDPTQFLARDPNQGLCWYVYQKFTPPAGATHSFMVNWPLWYDTFVISSGKYSKSEIGMPIVSYPVGESDIMATLFSTFAIPDRELLSINGPLRRNLGGPIAAAGASRVAWCPTQGPYY